MISEIQNAIEWIAAQPGVRVSVHSWAITVDVTATLETVYRDVRRDQGLLAFASSGNAAAPVVTVPARYDAVNAVGASDPSGQRWVWSNYGDELRFMAPGVDILTTDPLAERGAIVAPSPGGDSGSLTGTSFAAPMVAGVAAAVLSVNEGLDPVEVEHILCTTSRELASWTVTPEPKCGLIDAGAAVALGEKMTFYGGFEESGLLGLGHPGDTTRWSATVP